MYWRKPGVHNCSGGIQEVKNMKVLFSTSQGYVSAPFSHCLVFNHIVIIITRLKVILLENKIEISYSYYSIHWVLYYHRKQKNLNEKLRLKKEGDLVSYNKDFRLQLL